MVRVEVARSRAPRYCDSSTVRLRISPMGIQIWRASQQTRYNCPFCWKNLLNNPQSTLPSSYSHSKDTSSDGILSKMKTARSNRQSTTTSPIFSLRWVTMVSVNFLMAVRSRTADEFMPVWSIFQNQFKMSILASSSASVRRPLYFSYSFKSPIYTQLSAEYAEILFLQGRWGSEKEGLPRLGWQGLGILVPGCWWLSCFDFLWLEYAGQEEQNLPHPHWYLGLPVFVIIIIKERSSHGNLIQNRIMIEGWEFFYKLYTFYIYLLNSKGINYKNTQSIALIQNLVFLVSFTNK